ncbi:hypothetical protein MJI37_35995, partial [Salmonella enterica subsp. enterica serovar Cerro]|nr:hypothetical protein [Salmonella enterica subsp. enterica serovar Cerro]
DIHAAIGGMRLVIAADNGGVIVGNNQIAPAVVLPVETVFLGAVWNYSEQDNQWQLTTADGKTLNVTGWDVTDANAAVIEGTQ